MRLFLLSLVLIAAPLSGCAAVAIAGAGFLISRELLPDDVHTAHVRLDADETWEDAKETIDIIADIGTSLPITTDTPRRGEFIFDGARVEIQVDAYDLDHTIISVQAKDRLGSNAGETASRVLTRILEYLED